jgi:hypothetical protein
VRAPLPPTLPDHLADYDPARVHVVAPDAWPVTVDPEELGVRTTLPRYALQLRTLDVPIDPDRVRWLVERAATRTLDSRHIHVVPHRDGLHVVDGHHALAAHLAVGSERVPVKLVRDRAGRDTREVEFSG